MRSASAIRTGDAGRPTTAWRSSLVKQPPRTLAASLLDGQREGIPGQNGVYERAPRRLARKARSNAR
jgi:hypothetical protein